LESEQKEAMKALKDALCNALVQKTLDVSNQAGQIVLGVNASMEGWGAILHQEDEKKIRHPSQYESGHWNTAEKKYETGKRECRGLMRALKKFRTYVYSVQFFVETDANTLAHQLNLPAIDLPAALVNRWITWIRQFDFDVKHVPGGLNGGPDGLSRRPRGEWEPDPDDQEVDDLEETIEAILRSVRVEQKEGKGHYKLFVGVQLSQPYKGEWREIDEF
jgi:ribonuclease HI